MASTFTLNQYIIGDGDTAQTLTNSYADDASGIVATVSGLEQLWVTAIYTTGAAETDPLYDGGRSQRASL